MSAVRSTTAFVALCVALPAVIGPALIGSALAEPVKTPTTALDAYIDQTFGAIFERVGPTELITPDPTNKLGAGEPSPLLSTKVVWRERAQLSADLPLPSNLRTPLVLPKGTVFYKSVFRRAAEEAGTFEAWCGPFHFKWGINLDKDGWNLICLQKLADGKTAGFFQPTHQVYYTNGTSKPYYYPQPPAYASHLIEQKLYDIAFPQMEPVSEPAKPMELSLFAERPTRETRADLFSTRAYWGLFTGGVFSGIRVRNEPAGIGDLTRIRLGDQVVQVAYTAETRSYGAPSIDTARDADAKPVPSTPIIDKLSYIPHYQPEGPTTAPNDELPWRWGTLQLKPDTLSLVSGPLKKDATLLTLKAERVERRRVTNAPKPVMGVYLFQDGDPVYEWQATGYQPDGTRYRDRLLCGGGHISSAFGTRDVSMCVPYSPLNAAGSAERKNWDISARGYDFWAGMMSVGHYPYTTVADPDPAAAPITVEIRVDAGNDTHAELRVGMLEAGAFVPGDRLYLPYDKDGVARLHLWDRTLEIRRDGKLFSGAITNTASGFGPYYNAQ